LRRDDTNEYKASKGNVCDVKEEGKRHSMACDFKNHRLSLFKPLRHRKFLAISFLAASVKEC
jgi:gamma-glutamylcysteine synthetase